MTMNVCRVHVYKCGGGINLKSASLNSIKSVNVDSFCWMLLGCSSCSDFGDSMLLQEVSTNVVKNPTEDME